MRRNNNIILSLYEFSFVLLFFKTLDFYYFWNIHIIVFCIFNLLCLFLYVFFSKELYINLSLDVVFVCILLFLCYFSCTISGAGEGFFSYISVYLCMFFFLIFPFKIKTEILRIITITFAIVSLVSLVIYILVIFAKIPLPFFEVEYLHYDYRNYFFFLFRTYDGVVLEYNRFHSLFLEPGYMGCVGVLLLNANDFNFRNKYNKMILISIIFTFSLAAYLLLFISFLFRSLNKRNIKFLFLIIFIILLTFLFFYNKKDSIIYQEIISRLLPSESDGISGNNRFTKKFLYYYSEFKKSNDIYFGLGAEYRKLAGMNSAGYKVYVMQYGVVGTFFVILFYSIISLKNFCKKTFELFVLNVLIFINLGYPLWTCILITYIAGCENLSQKKIEEIKNYVRKKNP